MELKDRYALITGAGKGLGKCIAKHFVKGGASVLLCSRTLQDLKNVKTELSPLLLDNQQIAVLPADVYSTIDLDNLFSYVSIQFPRLDILVNNAGVYGPFGPIDAVDWEQWVEAISINLLGIVYSCRKGVSLFKKQNYDKIVNLSGGGATNPLPRISAYAASKTAVVRFIETLALEVKEYNIDVNAIAHDALATQLTDKLIEAGPQIVGPAFYEKIEQVKESGGTPLEKGARLAVYLASSKSYGVTGKLVSAVWDPWENLHTYTNELNTTDIYTLRRIVPDDRGKMWVKQT